jgi:hypothetical protein
MAENTYTYTARSATNPDEVVTFTLQNNTLVVDLGAPLEMVEKTFRAPEGEGKEGEGTALAAPWLKPVIVSAVQWATKPFHINDVSAGAEGDGFHFIAWTRAGGLRLAPIGFSIERVDNPDAAHAFVNELKERKASAPHPGSLPGPLDYWASWFLAGLAAIGVGTWLLGRKKKEA